MSRLRTLARSRPAVWAALILLLVSLLWFAPAVLGGKTLIPADNLYQFEPWASLSEELGVGVPHNELLNDLLLENYVWKTFLRQAITDGEVPLWNPYLFTGVPFLAAGQHSALYPLSGIFYVLPLPLAFGVFTWLQVALAGLGAYVLGRALRLSPLASLFAGLAYAFSSFYIVSVVFTMIIAAAAWLPWLLACVETMVRKQEEKGDLPYSPVPYVIAGAVALGLMVLAGHPEIIVLSLLTTGLYALWRLASLGMAHSWRRSLRLGLWFLVMALAGLALGSVQLIPLLELVTTSFREGSASYDQVVGWAWPMRQILTFILPDFFGNPSHHGWFDPYQSAWRVAGPNALGQPVRDVFWGVKNYVEGGNYLGMVTLALAALAVVGALFQALSRHRVGAAVQETETSPADLQARPRNWNHVWLFAALAMVSLLFAFGTPLYAVLFYGVPGYKQLHSAFRWVLPYTLSMAILASFGLQWLLDQRSQTVARLASGREPEQLVSRAGREPGLSLLSRALGAAFLLAGFLALAVAGVSLAFPDPFAVLGQRIVDSSDLARQVFANGLDFWSYQWRNVLHLGAFSALAGLGLILLAWPQAGARSGGSGDRSPAGRRAQQRHWVALAVIFGALLLDLWLVLGRFNPAVDPDLLDPVPPSVAFLQEDRELWRLSTFEGQGTSKTFNANTPWWQGMQDVRGYDSIIPQRYVELMAAIEPQGQLLYNRISPFYDPTSLEDPLTDLLGLRYVMTELPLSVPGWDLVYDREVRIYRNQDALPRVFVASRAEAVPAERVLERMGQVDLRDTVILEAALEEDRPRGPELPSGFERPPEEYDGRLAPQAVPPPASPQLRTAQVSSYGLRSVFVDLNLSDRGWLVFTDAWFPGWKAYLRPFGASEDSGATAGLSDAPLEQELPIFRGDGNFRAVYIPQAGQWTVRFVYSPRSVLVGIYVSFLAVVSLLLLGASWAWGRFYRESEGEHADVRVVAKNTSVQMVLSLLNRAIDFAFAMLRLRVLGPAGEGSYAFAIAVYGFFEILVRFGLGTLLTRDVAQDKEDAGRYLVNVLALRARLWLISLPLLGLVMAGYALTGNLTAAEAQAIALFALALFFATLADSFSAVFNAYEKMEYPAAIASTIVVAKVALGALVILPPFNWGFVGLAAVSVLMNILQAAWLWLALRRHIPLRVTRSEVGRAVQRLMLRESYPLMLNHLLASVFWRIDLWILKPLAGAAAVGVYSAAVKYLDGLNVIPSYFTLAIFPLMSRYAKDSHESLVRAYNLAIRVLVMLALPIAITVTVLATPLIRILGGAAYLPDSATALRLIIWSIPIGFINSVTQYVLIAVGQQRFLTRAFVIGVAFNITANLVFIPQYGYRAAAVITVLSEFSLLIPFYLAVRRHVAPLPWVNLLWRQGVAAAGMGLVVLAVIASGYSEWLAAIAGWVVFVPLLVILGAFRDPEMDRIWQALRMRRSASGQAAGGE